VADLMSDKRAQRIVHALHQGVVETTPDRVKAQFESGLKKIQAMLLREGYGWLTLEQIRDHIREHWE